MESHTHVRFECSFHPLIDLGQRFLSQQRRHQSFLLCSGERRRWIHIRVFQEIVVGTQVLRYQLKLRYKNLELVLEMGIVVKFDFGRVTVVMVDLVGQFP